MSVVRGKTRKKTEERGGEMSIYSGFVYERFLGARQGRVDCNCETRTTQGVIRTALDESARAR